MSFGASVVGPATALLRDRWLDLWHALPPFRGRLAVARIVAQHLLTNRYNQMAWARLPNGYRMKVDLRWQGGYDVLYYFRTYEAPLASLIRRAVDAPLATFIDVGANIGAFCFLAADVLRRRGGRAWAIEPLPQNYAFLRESLRANALDDVIELLPVAVGDRIGTLVLEILSSGEIANARPLSLTDEAADGGRTAAVPMTKLDDLAQRHTWRHVEFVKLDIEGAELFALRGAQGLLEEQRPLVYAEFHREYMAGNGTTVDAVYDFASLVGFEVRFLSPAGVAAAPPPSDSRFLDLVLVPRSPTEHQRAVLGW